MAKPAASCTWLNSSTPAMPQTHRHLSPEGRSVSTHIASHTAPRSAAEHLGTEGFQEHARKALKDTPLQQALQLLVTNFVPRRVAAMAALGNAEELRTEARAIKERTMARLDEYLERFATQAQRVGVQVHWAHDAAEARQIITDCPAHRRARDRQG